MLRAARPPRRRYGGKISDPRQWDVLRPRAWDIVVSTPPKSGTTWMQGILALLLSGDADVDAAISRTAPWIDVRGPDQGALMDALNAQVGRRQMKTHTPLDGIPLWPDLRYITVYRHPIDVHLSFRRHVAHMTEDVLQDVFPPDLSEGFRIFLEGDHFDGASLASILDHYRSTRDLRDQQNVLCLHYADMSADLPGAMDTVAAHIGVHHPPPVMARLVDAARFANMKRNAGRFAVAAGEGFWRNDADFFDSGTSGKWVDMLSDADLAAYDARMDTLLAPAERAWLEWGGTERAE
ncbi:MAG: sulfotransferase domain-containing protein [Pseudomonadota bacterium]